MVRWALLGTCLLLLSVAGEPDTRQGTAATGPQIEEECELASLVLLQRSRAGLASQTGRGSLDSKTALNGQAAAGELDLATANSEEGSLDAASVAAAEGAGSDLLAVSALSRMATSVSGQLEYELSLTANANPVKNKVVLALLELVGLGLCGVDRCYMGQPCVGVIKGLTLGGLTVWAFIDYVGVIITCLSMHSSINSVGMRANFSQGSILAAFILVTVLLALKLLSTALGLTRLKSIRKPKPGEDVPRKEEGQ